MERNLSILGILAILVFSITSLVFDLDTLSSTLIGKTTIGFVVVGAIVPWMYLIEKNKGHVGKKQFAIYFLGCWLLAPYFLYKIHRSNTNAP